MRFWHRFETMLSRTEEGTSIALFRICMALCVVYTVVDMMFTAVAEPAMLDVIYGGYRQFGHGPWAIKWFGGPTPTVLYGFTVTAAVTGLAVALGVGGPILSRVLAFVCLQTFSGLTDLNGHAGGSYDELMANGMWLLVLAGPSRTWSVECRRATGAWTSARPVPFWPRFLVLFQLILMYWTTGLQKASAYWTPGGDFSALYYILQQPSWQRADMTWLAWVFPLTQLGTAATWFWEVFSPLWLVALLYTLPPAGPRLNRWNGVRVVYTALGLIFHVLVVAMMNIGPFTWASMAFYPAVVHPHEWWRWLGRPTSPAPPPAAAE